MVSRIWFSGILLGIFSYAEAQTEIEEAPKTGSPLSTATISWTDKISSPAVCLGRDHWFVSILPKGVERSVADEVSLEVSKKKFPARILFLHPSLQLCLIQGPEGLPKFRSHPLADFDSPEAGTKLHCRTPRSNCRTTVAGKDYHYLGKPLPVPLLRVRIAEENHFCKPGTPLINASGELEGLLTERVHGVESQAHAIPVAQLHKLVHEFERFKRSGKVWVGMVFHKMSTTPEVLEVREESPARKAGVVAGDVVIELNDQDVENLTELAEMVRSLPAGAKTELTVLRGLERVELALVPEFSKTP